MRHLHAILSPRVGEHSLKSICRSVEGSSEGDEANGPSNPVKRMPKTRYLKSGRHVHARSANRQARTGLPVARRITMDAKVTATAPFVRDPSASSTLNILGDA